MNRNLAPHSASIVFAPATAIRALILDDSRVDRRRIERLCREAEFAIDLDEASTLRDFAAALDGPPYDLFLIDYRLAEGDGMIALEMLARHPAQQHGVAIMIAGEGQVQVAVDAMKAGCGDFLMKDHLTVEGLSRAISRILRPGAKPAAVRVASGAVQPAAQQFAIDHGGDMRAILSGMLRHVRTLRHSGGPEAALEGVEAAAARLWNFLEALRIAERDAKPAASASFSGTLN